MKFLMPKDFLIHAIEDYSKHHTLTTYERIEKLIHVKNVLKVVAHYSPIDQFISPYQALLDGIRYDHKMWEDNGHKFIDEIRIVFDISMPDGPKRMEMHILDYDFIRSYRMIKIKNMYAFLY